MSSTICQMQYQNCFGGDVLCGGPGQTPIAIGNIQSANSMNLLIGGFFGGLFSAGARLVGLASIETETATPGSIVFKHGARHLAGTGLDQATVENAITADVQKTLPQASASGNFWNKVVVNGQQILYKAWTLPNGTISVGTYYRIGAPGRNLNSANQPIKSGLCSAACLRPNSPAETNLHHLCATSLSELSMRMAGGSFKAKSKAKHPS